MYDTVPWGWRVYRTAASVQLRAAAAAAVHAGTYLNSTPIIGDTPHIHIPHPFAVPLCYQLGLTIGTLVIGITAPHL
jgi:hypothetical protein